VLRVMYNNQLWNAGRNHYIRVYWPRPVIIYSPSSRYRSRLSGIEQMRLFHGAATPSPSALFRPAGSRMPSPGDGM